VPDAAASSTDPGIDQVVIGDEPDAWRGAGFRVDDEGVCRLGTVRLRLEGRDRGRGIRGWTLRGVDVPAIGLDGLATGVGRTGPAEPDEHPNGARFIDHVVVLTPDMTRSVAAYGAAGLTARRVRDTDSYGAPMRQTFFRLGEVILEVVGTPGAAGEGPARFFGLAVSVDHLDPLIARYGDQLGRIKNAVQPGRRIATLRHRDAGLSTAIAFMDDHPR